MSTFSWVSFYAELANKILGYKDSRSKLVDDIVDAFETHGIEMSKGFFIEGQLPEEVDPFTFYSLFNRYTNDRMEILLAFRDKFGVETEPPVDFDGIPVQYTGTLRFFDDAKAGNEYVSALWDLFVSAMDLADDDNEITRKAFISSFDKAQGLSGLKWNLTMGLFWIRPEKFLNLDSRNRIYMSYEKHVPESISSKLRIVDKKNAITGEEYLALINMCEKCFDGEWSWDSFESLSYEAWIRTLHNSEYYGHMEEPNELELETFTDSWYEPCMRIGTNAYDPDLTKDQYLKCFQEIKNENPQWLDVLAYLINMGGKATCTQIAERYGLDPQHYNVNAANISEKVIKMSGCKPWVKKNGEKSNWPVLFVGKDVSKDDTIPGTFVYNVRPYVRQAMMEIGPVVYQDENEKEKVLVVTDNKMSMFPKNMILQGPPGTGKTYITMMYAVAIIEGKTLEDIKTQPYGEIKKRYDEYYGDKRIAFTTFHQSFGYEEFIEGIKPVMDGEDEAGVDIQYTIESGVFKKFCDEAAGPVVVEEDTVDYGFRKNPTIWKVSLGGTGENPIRKECLDNGHIRIGWDEYGPNIADAEVTKGRVVLNTFVNRMQEGDIVLSCFSSKTIDAIGVVIGDYEWHEEFGEYQRLRKVNWLAKGFEYDIYEMNGGNAMTLPTVYRLSVTLEDVLKILEEVSGDEGPKYVANDKPYVFIIDEINRGNISKIFGELITLIEDTKRIGRPEEMHLTLPYSGKSSAVPDNVYIIGTMNTADRSIAMMDTALRRRFDFVEMQPDPSVLSGINVQGIDIEKMLTVMNQRIELLYDREHTLGHSYFLPLKNDPTLPKLAAIFKQDIVPLLQEYFFDDYEKIRLVLADNQKDEEHQFITTNDVVVADLFGNTDIVDSLEDYDIHWNVFDTDPEAYRGIYE